MSNTLYDDGNPDQADGAAVLQQLFARLNAQSEIVINEIATEAISLRDVVARFRH